MESSLALGRLELTPGSAPVEVSLAPLLPGAPQAKEKSGQRQGGPPQGRPHLHGCVPLSHQVAGHKYGVDKVGILQHPDGTVLKQLQPPPRGPREMQFYSMVYAEDCCDPCLLELQNHLPKYYGTWSSPDSPNDLYLKLEDVTRRFKKPCIMDVKLGQRSYDPYASQEKREQQIRKYPLMEEIGFLVLGMRVYKVCSDTCDSYDQHYGRGLGKDTVKDGLAKFFHNGASLRKDAVLASIWRVQRILRWVRVPATAHLFASSLLFVYEGLPSSSARPQELTEYNNNNNIQVAMAWDYSLDAMYTTIERQPSPVCQGSSPWQQRSQYHCGKHEEEEEEEEEGGGDAQVEVRMIDFAHVFPSDSHDQGYIYGLKHLLTVLEQILCDAS
uniref:Kinase n=1 Tax=Sphaeramia orbicularis TaxID=375764 RepID=A0A673BY61_9TELE